MILKISKILKKDKMFKKKEMQVKLLQCLYNKIKKKNQISKHALSAVLLWSCGKLPRVKIKVMNFGDVVVFPNAAM